ncbi:hypothetical protein N7471_009722 [Penicillium samsonianum]|uniref:uncharacterized protein n=1 Tax=Penicillium samsonianum TaxID=1882272 RepID=UPI002548C352|nr:uncharacterized protein N7471_009722 [Penicillium samsonianum]KAJ6128505.1 hypothetical protein N7471_009722 [Penicillium samsonianum]
MPVGPRVSKEEFMHALGLNPQDPHHEQYYRAMRDEAIIVYNRMNLDTSNLLDNVRADPATRPPSSGTTSARTASAGRSSRSATMRRRSCAACSSAGRRMANTARIGSRVGCCIVFFGRGMRKGEVGGSAGSESDKRTRQEETTQPKKYYDPVRNGTL